MRVINCKDFGGRKQAEAAGVIYLGRPTILGNPYAISPAQSRSVVIDKYRRWLYNELCTGNPQVIAALEAIPENAVLGCWCSPEACHCEVIASAWHWWRSLRKVEVNREAIEAELY